MMPDEITRTREESLVFALSLDFTTANISSLPYPVIYIIQYNSSSDDMKKHSLLVQIRLILQLFN